MRIVRLDQLSAQVRHPIGPPAGSTTGPFTPPRSDDAHGLPVRRWTINGDFLALKENGIARFAREVTVAFEGLIAEGHPLTRGLAVDLVAPVQPRDMLPLRHIEMRVLAEMRPRLPQVWVQCQLPRHVKGGLLSFCNLAPIRVDRHIVCIHDMQTRLSPESYGVAFRLVHRVLLPLIGRRADITTTVSEFSKGNLVRFGVGRPETIAVVYNGADHAVRWRTADSTRDFREGRPFVLCIGRNEAHKNMRLIWNLARRLDLLGVDIVVVGDLDPSRLDAATLGRPRNIRCLGRVSDADLARGFAEALCFLFPSRTEGFGLPAMEAMASGCPVVASNAPCLPEVYGNGAMFADPDDEIAWVAAVETLLNKPGQRQDLREAGRLRALQFTWRSTAVRYLELMMTVDNKRGSAPA